MATPELEVGAPFVFQGVACTVTALNADDVHAEANDPDAHFQTVRACRREVEYIGNLGALTVNAFAVKARMMPIELTTEMVIGGLTPMEG